MSAYIAHVRSADGETQSLKEHLFGVAEITSRLMFKLELADIGKLIGLLHDFGKYSLAFQNYINSAEGRIHPDEDDYVDANKLRGKIDHSTAGARFIWDAFSNKGSEGKLAGQILALCIASHHSGLIDCLTQDGADNFSRRMVKPDEKTHLNEAKNSADKDIISLAQELFENHKLSNDLICVVKKIHQFCGGKNLLFYFHAGLLVRFIFSCLIDADRLDTADFEQPRKGKARQHGKYLDWETLISRLNKKLDGFSAGRDIDKVRADVSRHCFEKAHRSRGLFTLTVPTGGGKTLASIRFALHHAQKHNMDRILYVIPYTSIIDQNAKEIRKILEEPETDKRGSVVLEYHSNLVFENHRSQWREKLLAENWDAPIIFTTSVQFLECLFGGGTRNARRMHQLSNAVIIFDEIQTLPVRTVHMFNNAINFLTETCHSSVVLCTATQPLLGKVDPQKGTLCLDKKNEIMEDTQTLFSDLKRTEIVNKIKDDSEWSDEEVSELAQQALTESGSCLIIVNTKAKAKAIYQQCKTSIVTERLYHLSTNMCAAHRTNILEKIKSTLDKEPVLCISTQLIEAGVDIDFGSVIRSVAGMDSIAQAAGRCNRHGRKPMGYVYVVNLQDEKTDGLTDIAEGKKVSERIFRELKAASTDKGEDIQTPKVMNQYFEYYFFKRKEEMLYSIGSEKGAVDDNLLNLLSENKNACAEYRRMHQDEYPPTALRHAFMTAGQKFTVINAGTQGIIVPYGKTGKKIIGDLCGAYNLENNHKLLRKAQRYSVNVYPYMIKKLEDAKAIFESQIDSGIYCLKEQYYSEEFGISEQIESLMDTLQY